MIPTLNTGSNYLESRHLEENSSESTLEVNPLEACIRTALELGELSPGLEAQIKHWALRSQSEHNQSLLKLLQDALEDGCICRVSI